MGRQQGNEASESPASNHGDPQHSVLHHTSQNLLLSGLSSSLVIHLYYVKQDSLKVWIKPNLDCGISLQRGYQIARFADFLTFG